MHQTLAPSTPTLQTSLDLQQIYFSHHDFFNALIALWTKNSAEDILKYFSYFFQKKSWHFMHNVSTGDNLHKMSKPVLLEKISSICCLLK